MERMMDDRELARMVVSSVMDEIPVQVGKLKDSLRSDDAAGVRLQAHSIKGAAANVGSSGPARGGARDRKEREGRKTWGCTQPGASSGKRIRTVEACPEANRMDFIRSAA